MIRIELPIRTVSESNMREHWAPKAKRAKWQRNVVALAVRPRLAGMLDRVPCVVTLTRIAPRALDDDNLARSFKAIRDQVAAELGVDDRDARVVWRYAQRRGGKGAYGVEIVVTPVAIGVEFENAS